MTQAKQIRGLLAEFGIVIPQGIGQIGKRIHARTRHCRRHTGRDAATEGDAVRAGGGDAGAVGGSAKEVL